jgi:hypothetical protein
MGLVQVVRPWNFCPCEDGEPGFDVYTYKRFAIC